jgi:hypothetical protein
VLITGATYTANLAAYFTAPAIVVRGAPESLAPLVLDPGVGSGAMDLRRRGSFPRYYSIHFLFQHIALHIILKKRELVRERKSALDPGIGSGPINVL